MTEGKKDPNAADALIAQQTELRRIGDRQNRQDTQLSKLERAVPQISDEVTRTHTALWESMVEINTQIGICRAQVEEVKGMMDLVQAAMQAQERHNHGQAQYAHGRRIGWREGFWAGGGAILATLGVKYDALLNFLRSIGGSSG